MKRKTLIIFSHLNQYKETSKIIFKGKDHKNKFTVKLHRLYSIMQSKDVLMLNSLSKRKEKYVR